MLVGGQTCEDLLKARLAPVKAAEVVAGPTTVGAIQAGDIRNAGTRQDPIDCGDASRGDIRVWRLVVRRTRFLIHLLYRLSDEISVGCRPIRRLRYRLIKSALLSWRDDSARRYDGRSMRSGYRDGKSHNLGRDL